VHGHEMGVILAVYEVLGITKAFPIMVVS
jgi:hypothetical protein